MEKVMDVVGTMFFNNGKLLIDKPRKRSTYQMIGGKVEKSDSSILSAAIRECREELGDKVYLDENLFAFVMDFKEVATSNPDQIIHMHIFMYLGELVGELSTSSEIEAFMWFGINDDINLLSNTLKNEVVPYAVKQKLLY